MFNVSTEFRRNLYNDNRNYLLYADVVLANGTKLQIENAQIWNSGYRIDNAVSGDNSFDIGSVIIDKLTLIINNMYDDFSEYDFTGATITAYIGMQVSAGTEKICRGVYSVDEATYNGSTISLECLDNLQRLDKPYSLSKLTYPATVRTILHDVCSCCGLQMATAAFEHDDYVVDTRPDDSSITFRQVVLWCVQVVCKWAKADEYGRLKLVWYDIDTYEGLGGLDGGVFDEGSPSYVSGDRFDGGNFSDYSSCGSFDGGTFADQKKYHHIYATSSTNLCTDDVVITGIRVVCEEEKEVTDDFGSTSTQKADVTYQAGEDGYMLTISGNKLIQNGKGSVVAASLGAKLIGLRFRPFSVSCLNDPSIEAGDICFITDRKGNTYKSLITNTIFQPGSYQSISCGAESPLRNSATRYSEATKVYQELRKNMDQTKTEWEKAMVDLDERLENSGGLYTTIETKDDGSKIYYMHDKALLKDSMIVWKMTKDAWGVSTDGGNTWNGGMTVDGEMIIRILNTIGLNADWINSGSIVIKDARNNVTFLADTETGEVRVVADSFTLRGKTVEELAIEANEDILDALERDIQTQLDGKIETYNQTTDPSTAWTTATAKAGHKGDLWYSTATKLTKRWSGTAWATQESTDLAAQELAKSKAKVFISTPQPPYVVGDLWIGNSSSEMKRCKTARTSGSYVSSDWILATKYTDDTMANSAYYLAEDALNTANDAESAATHPVDYLSQIEVFNKLTNNGSNQGIYLSGGKIYINANYIASGYITAGYINGGTLRGVEIIGESGKIGGFQITSEYLRCQSGSYNMYMSSYAYNNSTVMCVQNSGVTKFLLNYDGRMLSEDLTANGSLTASGKYALGNGVSTSCSAKLNGGMLEITGDGYTSRVWPDRIQSYSSSTQRFRFSSDCDWADGFIETLGNLSNFFGTSICYGSLSVKGSLSVSGSKNRLTNTQSYGKRFLNSYELTTAMFGDVGTGRTDESGYCYISIDDIFLETVDTQMGYFVFLQKESEGDIWVEEKRENYFLVRGSSNLKFSWEIKARQKGFGAERIECDMGKTHDGIHVVNYLEEGNLLFDNYIERETSL